LHPRLSHTQKQLKDVYEVTQDAALHSSAKAAAACGSAYRAARKSPVKTGIAGAALAVTGITLGATFGPGPASHGALDAVGQLAPSHAISQDAPFRAMPAATAHGGPATLPRTPETSASIKAAVDRHLKAAKSAAAPHEASGPQAAQPHEATATRNAGATRQASATKKATHATAHAALAEVKHPASHPHHAAPAEPTKPYSIYDSITPSSLPADQPAAVYATGDYAAAASSVSGHSKVLWIDTTGSDYAASALDVEPGDATPAQAAYWAEHRLSDHPGSLAIIYTMRSEWPQVQAAVGTLSHSMQSRVRWWIADPTGVPHIVPGAAATQWYWGQNYDITSASPRF
jgi:hypothetical protein